MGYIDAVAVRTVFCGGGFGSFKTGGFMFGCVLFGVGWVVFL